MRSLNQFSLSQDQDGGDGDEIFLMGMSDEEEADKESEDEEDNDTERNVVASAVQQSSAGAFIVGAGLAPPSLGLTEADPALDLGLLAASRSRRPSVSSCEGGGASPLLSPLIAQLNPFTPPLGVRRAPELPWAEELPPAGDYSTGRLFGHGPAPDRLSVGSNDCAVGAADSGGSAAVMDTAEDDSEAASAQTDAQTRLLVEMGDLVCKLQERRELSITSLEVSNEEMLSRLAHFRDLAGSAELRCRS